MVVDGHRERSLRAVLADHVLVENLVYLARLRQRRDVKGRWGDELLVDDLVTEIDAFVADVDARAGDQLLDLSLGLATETAEQLFVGIGRSGHDELLLAHGQCSAITRSMMPYSRASSELMK